MLKRRYVQVLFLLVTSFVVIETSAKKPDWVVNPNKDGGIAASSCTSVTGNDSLDRQMAMAMARSELVKQIEVKIETVDELLQSKTEDDELKIEFKSTSKQIATKSLKKSVSSKLEVIDNDGKQELCVLLHLEKQASEAMFRSIVKAMPVSLSVAEEESLFQNF